MKYALLLLMSSQLFGIFQIFAMDTYPVTMFDVGALAFLAVAAKRIFWDGESLEFPRNYATIFLIGLVVAAILSSINPILDGDPVRQFQFIKTTVHFLYLMVLVLLASGLHLKISDWKLSIQTILILAIGVHIFGVYQLIARALDLPLAWISLNNVSIASRSGYDISAINQGDVRQISLNYGSFYRATSIFSEPSALAGFCIFVLTALLVPYLREIKHFVASNKFIMVVTILTIISLFLTFSLTALSLLIGLIVYSFISERSKKSIKLLKMVLGISIIIISTDAVVESVTDISVSSLFTQRVGGIVSKYTGGRVESTDGESFFSRLSTITYAMDVWYTYPVTGVGMGCYYYFNKSESHAFSDSGVFSCLAETGFIGLVMYVGMITSLFISLRKIIFSSYYQQLQDDTKLFVNFSLYNVMIMMIASFTANTFVSSQFWLEISLFYSIISISHREIGLPTVRVRVMNVPLKLLISQSVPY